MIKSFRSVGTIFVGVLVLVLSACTGETDNSKSSSKIDALFQLLYTDPKKIYDDTFEKYKMEGKDEDAAYVLSSIDKLKSMQIHFGSLSEASRAAYVEEGSSNQDLQVLANMFGKFQSESEEYLQIAENFDQNCPAGKAKSWNPSLGNGSDKNRLCITSWYTILNLEEAPITCMYLGASQFLEKYPAFDSSKVSILNSVSKSVADQACSILPNAYSVLGFPKILSAMYIPERIRQSAETEWVVEIAGGLYTDYLPDTPILSQVVNGTWYGYCSVYRELEARLVNGYKSGECY